jgi:hypothetical protein
LAARQLTTLRRRGATARRGEVDGATAAFARAWAYGGTQMLGACARETGKAKTYQRLSLCPLPDHARRLGHGGARVEARDGGKKQDVHGQQRRTGAHGRVGGEGTRMTLKASPFSPACACTKATRVAKATTTRRVGRRGGGRKKRKPRARPRAHGRRARVRGCTAVRWRTGFLRRMGVRMPAARPQWRTKVAAHGKVVQGNKKQDKHLRACGMTAATPAR